MTTILQGLGAFVVGLVARLGIVMLALAVLASPALLALAAVRLWRSLRPAARGLRRVGHVLYKPGARYAAGHTWVEREGEHVRVGLDGVAQEILPWALSVELPRPGERIAEGQVVARISCGSVDARIAAPVGGRVVAVNPEVQRDPSLLKEDGYGRGWLVAIEPADSRWATLPAGELAREWMKEESDRLDRFLETRHGLAGASARAVPPPLLLEDHAWRDLTHAFLHA